MLSPHHTWTMLVVCRPKAAPSQLLHSGFRQWVCLGDGEEGEEENSILDAYYWTDLDRKIQKKGIGIRVWVIDTVYTSKSKYSGLCFNFGTLAVAPPPSPPEQTPETNPAQCDLTGQ